jgi:hypothetical protein
MMADVTLSLVVPSEAAAQERRPGVDRRSGQDRRIVNLWRETGRLGLELRTGADRRSGADRRGDRRHRSRKAMEFVTPWQIPEEQVPERRG